MDPESIKAMVTENKDLVEQIANMQQNMDVLFNTK